MELAEKAAGHTINIERIMEMIPHRYPFLLIDKLVDVVPGDHATGLKNVTMNEPYFQGHFPQRPVMPGVLVLEALAQACGQRRLARQWPLRHFGRIGYRHQGPARAHRLMLRFLGPIGSVGVQQQRSLRRWNGHHQRVKALACGLP